MAKNQIMNDVLDVSRKHWVSLLCGVIAILAVLSFFFWVNPAQDKLQADLAGRKKTYDALEGLLRKPRHEPIVSEKPDAQPKELDRFPNPVVLAAGESAIKSLRDQSAQIAEVVSQGNARPPLLPDALPTPQDPYKFQRAYLQQLQSVIPTALNAVTPPTEQQIQAEQDRRAAQLTEQAPKDSATGKVYNQQALDQEIARMVEQLPELMRHDAASKHKIYLAPEALSLHPDLLTAAGGAATAPDAEKIWYAQMGLWIQQDLVSAIIELNKASKDIDHSVVKQLVAVDIAPDHNLYAIPSAGAGTAAAATPATPGQAPVSPVPAGTDTDPLPKDYTVSPTGRVCNGVFDVVHFTVTMNVQAPDINRVIQELERNRLVTVYQTDVQAVNSLEQQKDGYYFGRSPVATLTLHCEGIYMRDWTRKLMPKTVRDYLNVQDPAAGQAGQSTASAN